MPRLIAWIGAAAINPWQTAGATVNNEHPGSELKQRWRLSVAPMMDWTDELLSTYCSKPFADVAVWIALQLHFEG